MFYFPGHCRTTAAVKCAGARCHTLLADLVDADIINGKFHSDVSHYHCQTVRACDTEHSAEAIAAKKGYLFCPYHKSTWILKPTGVFNLDRELRDCPNCLNTAARKMIFVLRFHCSYFAVFPCVGTGKNSRQESETNHRSGKRYAQHSFGRREKCDEGW